MKKFISDRLTRWKSDDGKTYEYNPFLHSYREVDEHREMVAGDLFPPIVRAEDILKEVTRDKWQVGKNPWVTRGNDHG
jgi:hypothetical protein